MPEQRRIRTSGRPTYGRPVPSRSRSKRPSWSFRIGLVQRRILMLVGGAIIFTLIARQTFAVRTVTVQPAGTAASQLTISAKQLAAKGWLSNLLTLNDDTFSSAFLSANPVVKSVAIRRHWPNSLALTVVLKQPSLGWQSGNDGYLLDADGTVIGPLPVGTKVPIVVDDSNLPVTIGQAVTSTRFVSFVTSLSVQIPNIGLISTKYEVKDTTLDLYVTTNRNYQLIFDTSRSVGDEVGDLNLVLGNLKTTGKTPAQYIDLRIAGRAYFK